MVHREFLKTYEGGLMSYPKWVQVEGHSGTTAWCKEDEDRYYASFHVGNVISTENEVRKKRAYHRKMKEE